MYGLVNRAIEQLVTTTKDHDAWQRICDRAMVENNGFVSMRPYHDDMTYRLVSAASEELGLSPAQVLEAFGEYWILYTAEEGYGEVLRSAGDHLRGFLNNLNDMHGRVESVFPHMRLPQFRVEDIAPGEYRVYYASERHGLAPMVRGLITGLAKRFGQQVEVQHSVERGGEHEEDVFVVREINN